MPGVQPAPGLPILPPVLSSAWSFSCCSTACRELVPGAVCIGERDLRPHQWLCLREVMSALFPSGPRSEPSTQALSLCARAVPSASMTRLARSRTASLTSASSVDGARPRACTHSESTEAMGQINHTMEVSC